MSSICLSNICRITPSSLLEQIETKQYKVSSTISEFKLYTNWKRISINPSSKTTLFNTSLFWSKLMFDRTHKHSQITLSFEKNSIYFKQFKSPYLNAIYENYLLVDADKLTNILRCNSKNYIQFSMFFYSW